MAASVPENACSSTDSSSLDAEADHWWLHRPKNVTIQGTWEEESAFQISLKCRDEPEDPLSIPLCCDWIPYHCVPHCGVYGHSDYELTHPLSLIMLPSDELVNGGALFSALPNDLQHYLSCHPVGSPAELNVLVIFHSLPSFESSVDPSSRLVNVVFHMWALKGVDMMSTPEVHITMEMGGFSPVGIMEVPPISEAEELSGLPLERVGSRILHMHNLSFSPHNAQVALMDSHQLHAFFSVGRLDCGRAVITYHIIPGSEEAESKIKEVNRSSGNFCSLLRQFRTIERSLSHSVCDGQSEKCCISQTLSLLVNAACAHISTCT